MYKEAKIVKEILKENKGFIRQIFKLSKSELIKTYKGAALGPAWAIIKPVFTIFVYWFAFAIGLRGGKAVTYNHVKVEFFPFLMVGIIPWFFMSDSILGGAGCYRKNKQFITKMRFPVSTISTFTILSNLYTHLMLTTIMYIILLCMGIGPSVYNLQFFIYMPLMFMFFWALSYITAPLSVISKDFLNLVRAIMTGLFWFSGIVYNPHMHKGFLGRLINSFPITFFANGYRNTFLFQKPFYETRYELFCFACWMILTAVLGALTYKRLRKTLPDVL